MIGSIGLFCTWFGEADRPRHPNERLLDRLAIYRNRETNRHHDHADRCPNPACKLCPLVGVFLGVPERRLQGLNALPQDFGLTLSAGSRSWQEPHGGIPMNKYEASLPVPLGDCNREPTKSECAANPAKPNVLIRFIGGMLANCRL
jgi:hypothetical protein